MEEPDMLKPKPSRLRRADHIMTTAELLDAVDMLQIWQDTDGSSHLYLQAVFGVVAPWDTVTDQINDAEYKRLVRLVEGPNGACVWKLTRRGRRVVYPGAVARVLGLLRWSRETR